MAAKDTGGQERASRQSEEVDEEVVDQSSDLKERQARLSEDVEDVLETRITPAVPVPTPHIAAAYLMRGSSWEHKALVRPPATTG